MPNVLNSDEIYKRIYPPDVRITKRDDVNEVRRLYQHCEYIMPIIEDMEKSVFVGSPQLTAIDPSDINTLHTNLLKIAVDILRQPPVVVSGVALRIAAAVINRQCNDENTHAAIQIFNDFDDLVEGYLEGYEAAYNQAKKKNAAFRMQRASGATIEPSMGAVCIQQEEYEAEARAVKLLALASIRQDIKVAGHLQQMAVEYLFEIGKKRIPFYHKVIMGCIQSLCDSVRFPSGMTILQDSYRRINIFAENRAADLVEKKDQDEKQNMMYDLIGLDTDILLNCSTVPSLVNLTTAFCRDHWEILTFIHLKDAQNFLDQIDTVCTWELQNPDARMGVQYVLDLTRELRGKRECKNVGPDQNAARKGIIDLTTWVPPPSLAQ